MKSNHFICILLISITLYSQNNYTIKGKVTDELTNEPLIGVNVVIDELNIGASTDKKGNFILENITGDKQIIRFSYVGYITQRDTMILNEKSKVIELNMSLNSFKKEVIKKKPEIEEYQFRLQNYADHNNLLRIHIDSLTYKKRGYTFIQHLQIFRKKQYI